MDKILEYWFADADRAPVTLDAMKGRLALWFGERPETDEHIRAHFGAELAAARAGERSAWAETPRGSLALVVVLDQFSRNAYRGTPEAFASDAQSLAVMEAGIAAGFDRGLNVAQRVAYYLPLMHAEDRASSDRCLALYLGLVDEAGASLQPAMRLVKEATERHHRIVQKLGRYPHRNAVLGRASTPEEEAFMKTPDSSYQPSQRA